MVSHLSSQENPIIDKCDFSPTDNGHLIRNPPPLPLFPLCLSNSLYLIVQVIIHLRWGSIKGTDHHRIQSIVVFNSRVKMIKSISVVVALVALLGLACAKPSSFDAQGRRIVNGTATTIETIPFQVSILFFNSQWCGGAILDETTILTASHCFDNYFNNANQLSSWSVRAGSSYWANGGQLVQLQYVVRHAQYNPNTYDFDIAIIKLASALTFNTAVQPVVLAQTDSVLSAGQSIQVSGWGRLTVRLLDEEVIQGELVDYIISFGISGRWCNP